MSFNYIHYTEIDSTNKEAKRYVSEGGALPAMILADRQTAGRGRMGRKFFSSDIGGLYVTIVLKAPTENVFMRATALAAVCTVDSLRELFGVETQIKWVNDIFYKSKKLGGILAESFFIDDERYVAVGFGINLYVLSFPPELKDIAISLFSSYPNEEEQYRIKKELADRIADKFCNVVQSGKMGEVMTKYRKNCIVINKWITFNEGNKQISAFAFDVTDDGALAVRLADGTVRYLRSGEISVKLAP